MGRNRHLRGRGIGLAGLVAIALCLGLVFAVLASAKSVEYWAPLPRPDGENSWVEFKVKSKKNKKTDKFRPVAIKKFSVNFLLANCADGEPVQTSFIYPDQIPVSGRKFSISDTRGDTTFEASGRIPRKGPIQGTVRLAFVSGDPLNPQPCDSGDLSWTAQLLKRSPRGV